MRKSLSFNHRVVKAHFKSFVEALGWELTVCVLSSVSLELGRELGRPSRL